MSATPESRGEADLPPGTYVRILDHARDFEEGNPPYGQVGDALPVGGLLVAQAGSGVGVFAPSDLVRIEPVEIPTDALADIHRRSGMGPPDL